MPILTIDNRPVEVAAGTRVITAAEQLGIMIPRLCFHPALGAVGACRVCAVKFVEGPVKGIQMSCMVEAQDGMVVSTDDPEAVDFRRQVIEWLMVNHPHDCPVCDEGGHCLLQETTVSGGHGRRRYSGPKRTYHDQDLGPLIQHEMNRCIHCYRCSRFYQEYAGYRDYGVLGVADRVYFGRFQSGVLENPFAGNLADICPTGVLTDKPSRYFGRRWDYQRQPGICLSCSLGCNTTVSVRYRRVVRQEARCNPAVNGCFICDRGRHSYTYNDDVARPRQATVKGQAVTMAAALQEAAKRLDQLACRYGPEAVALWASPRASLESMGALLHLAEARQWRPPALFSDACEARAVRRTVADDPAGFSALESADFILLAGVDPLNEAPMLALAIRQAVRAGANVVALDPRPLELPCAVEQRRVSIPGLPALIRQAAGANSDAEPAAGSGPELLRRLQAARSPVVVAGTVWLDDAGLDACRELARAGGAAWMPVLPAANSFAAALLGDTAQHGRHLLEEIVAGRVRALILAECDPFTFFPDGRLLAEALDRLELLVVADYLPSRAVERAQVFLPSTTVYESGGIFINCAGRAQQVAGVHPGGIPLERVNQGSHPPRRYDLGFVGREPLSLVEICAGLLPAPPVAVDTVAWLARRHTGLAPLAAGRPLPAEGLQLTVTWPPREASAGAPHGTDDGWELLAAPLLFGGEELSLSSPQLQPLETTPAVVVAPETARELGLADGDRVRIDTGRGELEAAVRLDPRAAARTLIVPRHGRLVWQQMAACRQAVAPAAVRKV